jgi:hypothetical protein
MTRTLVVSVSLLSVLLAMPLEARGQARNGAPPSPPPTIAGTAVSVSKLQLNELRWIEGTWRGTGGGVPTFAEAYKFANDTLIEIQFFADSTAARVAHKGTIVLSTNQLFYTGNGTEYVATKISPTSVTFIPKGTTGQNTFVWSLVAPGHWTAVLQGGSGEITPPTVTYTMKRVK